MMMSRMPVTVKNRFQFDRAFVEQVAESEREDEADTGADKRTDRGS